jgi:hypothetical protein
MRILSMCFNTDTAEDGHAQLTHATIDTYDVQSATPTPISNNTRKTPIRQAETPQELRLPAVRGWRRNVAFPDWGHGTGHRITTLLIR